MSDPGRFVIELQQKEKYQLAVEFDWPHTPALVLDEPPPLGECAGPNASRLLAAAAAHCMAASLLYCLFKDDPPANCLRTQAACVLVRNDKQRLRVGQLEITLIAGEAITSSKRFARCKDLFEDFCVVSASIRQGIPTSVSIVDENGTVLY